MKSIALFGGSFDPPHIGHKAIVEALEKLEYIDKIIIMPTFLNPFKSSSHASAELRFKWLTQIFKDSQKVEIDKYEINQNRRVASIESVNYLLTKYKKIYLVIGADNLETLKSWKNYEELSKKVTFIIATRDDIDISDKYISLYIEENISSSELRKNMQISKLPQECQEEIDKFYKETDEK
jgi:nicotinate-nucleotide adenylyltransferase